MKSATKNTMAWRTLSVFFAASVLTALPLSAQEVAAPTSKVEAQENRRLSAEEIISRLSGKSIKGHHAQSNTSPTFTFHEGGKFSNDFGQTGTWKVVQGKTAGLLILDPESVT